KTAIEREGGPFYARSHVSRQCIDFVHEFAGTVESERARHAEEVRELNGRVRDLAEQSVTESERRRDAQARAEKAEAEAAELRDDAARYRSMIEYWESAKLESEEHKLARGMLTDKPHRALQYLCEAYDKLEALQSDYDNLVLGAYEERAPVTAL